jgi:hypothetical protein
VPNSSTAPRSPDGYAGRSGRGRRGGSCDAVLASTLMISVTCGDAKALPPRLSELEICFRYEGDIAGHHEPLAPVPAGPIEDHCGMRIGTAVAERARPVTL